MNLKDYIEQLENKNGYCQCQDLAPLYEQRKRTESLFPSCKAFQADVDLKNPLPQDRPFIQKYKEKVREVHGEAEEYYNQLTNLVSSGRLRLTHHNSEELKPLRPISLGELELIVDNVENERAIVTVHCSNCDQQIDLIKSY